MEKEAGPGRELPAARGAPDAVAVVRHLAEAKEQVAWELEANLKQLREVLKESERLAKDMEAVLKEARTPIAPQPCKGEGGRAEAGPGQKAGERPARRVGGGPGGGAQQRPRRTGLWFPDGGPGRNPGDRKQVH